MTTLTLLHDRNQSPYCNSFTFMDLGKGLLTALAIVSIIGIIPLSLYHYFKKREDTESPLINRVSSFSEDELSIEDFNILDACREVADTHFDAFDALNEREFAYPELLQEPAAALPGRVEKTDQECESVSPVIFSRRRKNFVPAVKQTPNDPPHSASASPYNAPHVVFSHSWSGRRRKSATQKIVPAVKKVNQPKVIPKNDPPQMAPLTHTPYYIVNQIPEKEPTPPLEKKKDENGKVVFIRAIGFKIPPKEPG